MADGARREITPCHNAALMFRVPRLHAVNAVTTDRRYRYSIFGWFYREPGG